MRNLLAAFFVFFMTLQITPQVMWQFNKDTVVTWAYEWGDEFEGSSIDKEKWSMGDGGGHNIYTNRELEYYTEGKNHVLGNGVLKLVAKKEPAEGKVIDWMGDNDSLWYGKQFAGFNKRRFNYTSGKLDSKPLFQLGYFEIRFKAPREKGMWPAFWLYGGDPDEEIDIFELKGEKQNKVHLDTHCPNECDYIRTWYGKRISWGGWLAVTENLTEAFNIMGCEWAEDCVRIYLNGKCIGYAPVTFKIPKTLQVNMAIAANDGPFHPGPDKNFTSSEGFEIDYIRVWKKDKKMNEETLRKKKGWLASVSTLKEGHASSRRRVRQLAGKSFLHKNEGPTVTLLTGQKNNFILYVLNLSPGQVVKSELLTLSGQVAQTGSYSSFQNDISLETLPSGTYRLRLTCNGKQIETMVSR